jgi:excinuclease ABC subunit A
MQSEFITIKGAKEHNLKDLNLEIPRNKLIVITGLSGSGKSSLAFDTIYAEGQRRYVESLSSYARQFLEQLQKPNVEHIEGISPAVSIEQRTAGSNPRSTVATQTEIYDYLRLLFARIGVAHCPKCGRKIQSQSSQQIVQQILEFSQGKNILILAPLVRGRKGEYVQLFQQAKKDGFVRVRVDGKILDLAEKIKLDKKIKHTIEVVVDRLAVSVNIKKRLSDSVETALKVGNGLLMVSQLSGLPISQSNPQTRKPANPLTDMLFSEHHACVDCGISLEEIEPRIFSFNSPYGACPKCSGLGTKLEIDADLVIPDKNKSIREGAIVPWHRTGKNTFLYYRGMLNEFAARHTFSIDTPFKELNPWVKNAILYGSDDQIWGKRYEGVIPNLERRFVETDSDYMRHEINKFMSVLPCPVCKGTRLKPESLAVKIQDKNIYEVTKFSIAKAIGFFEGLKLSQTEQIISHYILKEIKSRLAFMLNVGLGYITLDRASSTLSGGEAQRIRLATQIGAGLVGVLYILDEPSIGLHQRDNRKLLDTLKALRDLGNTLIVVEHDEATIRSGDYIIDLGPGAGKHGGYVVAQGGLAEILKSEKSLTARYLNGKLKIDIPQKRRPGQKEKFLLIKGAKEHNLKDIDVKIPLGVFVCVTGVSGSGKSTLVDEILYRGLAKKLYKSKDRPGAHKEIQGVTNIDKVIVIDQSPIGRTPRSNPATYTAAYSPIRDLFSRLPESRMRGFKPGRFSFNVKGGRCEACQGDGVKKIEMHFLPDVYVTCEICKGRRFSDQTLAVRYKGKSIADVLEMTVEEALQLFENIPQIKSKLDTLNEVGLGYIQLGQSATTLSGGEAQRIKLSAELSKRATGRTFYILDEPTTGLHFADVDKLLNVLHKLVDAGNTVLVIEHNLDVIKTADHIIDLGPEGGDKGGYIVAEGPPEEIIKSKKSYTGSYLIPFLI